MCSVHEYSSLTYTAGLEIFGGSKLLLPGARPGSKTNFVVAKLCVHLLRNENTETVSCISTTELSRSS